MIQTDFHYAETDWNRKQIASWVALEASSVNQFQMELDKFLNKEAVQALT